jgi:AcrR family transcriptional regulator
MVTSVTKSSEMTTSPLLADTDPGSPGPDEAGPGRGPRPVRSWRGVPIDARRSERKDRLVDAAYAVLGADPGGGLTVRGVCAEARLNARYFYESFENLEALYIAVYDRVAGEGLRAAVAAAVGAGPDPEASARAVVDAVVRYASEDPRRGRILFSEGLGMEALARRRRDAMFAMAQFVERYAWRVSGPADDRIGMVASLILTGGLTELVVTWLDGHLDMTLDDLVDDATTLLLTLGQSAVQTATRRQGRRRARR